MEEVIDVSLFRTGVSHFKGVVGARLECGPSCVSLCILSEKVLYEHFQSVKEYKSHNTKAN